MDPNSCLYKMLYAEHIEDRTAAAEDLLDWINKGGALPTIADEEDWKIICSVFLNLGHIHKISQINWLTASPR